MPRTILIALTCVSLAGAQAQLFRILDNPVPASGPVQSAGDIDGDGDQDLLLADGVLVNDGHGRFAKIAIPALAFPRQSASLADLNGDGLVDLASIAPNPGNPAQLRVDLNAGGLAFAHGVILPMPPGPFSLPARFALGDVDGDGDVDVVACTWTGIGGVGGGGPPAATPPAMWLNDGAGAFSLAPATSVPSVPTPFGPVILSDLDADGDADAVFAGTSGVVKAINTGGIFVLSATPIWPAGVTAIALGTLNGDALPDIVLCSAASTIVLWSTPTGYVPVTIPLPPGAPGAEHALVDVDGDGIDEILQATYYPQALSVHPVGPGGTLLGATQSWKDLSLSMSQNQALVTDLDGDGDRDVVAYRLDGPVPMMNGGTGLVRVGGRVTGFLAHQSLSVGDLDGDGDPDLLATHPSAVALATGINDGDGFFSAGPMSPIANPAPDFYYLHTFDRDGDGDLDLYASLCLAVSTMTPGPDIVYDNTGGTFTPVATVPGTGDVRGFQAADFDGDGDQDLVMGRWGYIASRPLAYVANLGSSGLAAPVSVGTAHFTYDVDVADFDANGTLDVFQTNSQAFGMFEADPCVVYLTLGNGTFVPIVQTGVGGHFTAVGDLNGDLMPDVVIDGQVRFNTGGGHFAAGPTLPSPLVAPASLADVDEDGDLDLVETPATVMFNAGGGVFGAPVSYLPRTPISWSASEIPESTVVDLDHDGDADIVAPGPIVLMNTTRQIAHGSIARPGRPASIDLFGTPSGAWFLWGSNGTTSLPLPPFGTVLIDPASAQLGAMGQFAGPTAPVPGTASHSVLVPNSPALVGWTTWWQAVEAGQMRLTNRIQITVLGY